MPELCPIGSIELAVAILCPDSPEIVVTIAPSGRLPFRVCVYRQSAVQVIASEPRREPTPAEEAVIDLLRNHPGLMAKQVARRLKVSELYARRLLARTKRRGFITHTTGQGYRLAVTR